MEKIIATFIISFVLFLFFMVLPSVFYNLKNYRTYKKTYRLLTSGKLEISLEDDHLVMLCDADDNIFDPDSFWRCVTFHKGNIIRLYGENKFSHPFSLLNMDPYAAYWHNKISNWFYENRDTLKIKDLRTEYIAHFGENGEKDPLQQENQIDKI